MTPTEQQTERVCRALLDPTAHLQRQQMQSEWDARIGQDGQRGRQPRQKRVQGHSRVDPILLASILCFSLVVGGLVAIAVAWGGWK